MKQALTPDYVPKKVAESRKEMQDEADLLEADPFMLEEKRY